MDRMAQCHEVATKELVEGSIASTGVGASSVLSCRVSEVKARILESGDLLESSAAERLELVEQLQSFSIGRSLLQQGALTGPIARAVATWPHERTARGAGAPPLRPLEAFLLDRSPTFRAFQRQHDLASRGLREAMAHPHGRSRSGAVAATPSRLAELVLVDPPATFPLPARLLVAEPDPQLYSDAVDRKAVSVLGHNCTVEHGGAVAQQGLSHVFAAGILDDVADDADAIAQLARLRGLFADDCAGELVLCGWAPLGLGHDPDADAEHRLVDTILLRDVVNLTIPGARTAQHLMELALAAGFSDAEIRLDGAAPVIAARR